MVVISSHDARRATTVADRRGLVLAVWRPCRNDPRPLRRVRRVGLAADRAGATRPRARRRLREGRRRLGRHEQRRTAELAAARTTIASLRPLPEHVPRLANGPHDLTVAAKGAAVYAARMAARE